MKLLESKLFHHHQTNIIIMMIMIMIVVVVTMDGLVVVMMMRRRRRRRGRERWRGNPDKSIADIKLCTGSLPKVTTGQACPYHQRLKAPSCLPESLPVLI